MFQRRFLSVTIGSQSFVIGSLSELEVQRQIADWNTDKPLNLTGGQATELTRSDCYRARVVACHLFDSSKRHRFPLGDDDCLLELVSWESGIVRTLHDLIVERFLRPTASVKDFLDDSALTQPAA